jgi:hypothetical protein
MTLQARVAQRYAASNKTWFDVLSEAEAKYMDEASKALASLLGGRSQSGGFASAEITYGDGKSLIMGFKGGSSGMVYVEQKTKKKREELSVVSHTPQTFANYLMNRLGLK